MISKKSIEEYLTDLSSSTPTPGGGSVSALCGAISAGLVEMVSNLTVEKREYVKVKNTFKEIIDKTERIRTELIELADEDANAFEAVIMAYRMPKVTLEQKMRRKKTIQEKLKYAVDIPLKIMDKLNEVMELSELAAEKGNINAITDAGVATLISYACMESASLNVKINLNHIKDETFVEQKKKKTENLLECAKKKKEKIMDVVYDKLKKL